MFKEMASDYKVYQGASDAEIGYGPLAVKSHLVDYAAENNQTIGVYVAEPVNGSDKTIIFPQQHEYRNEPFSIKRAEILASNTGSRIAMVETPGVESDRLRIIGRTFKVL